MQVQVCHIATWSSAWDVGNLPCWLQKHAGRNRNRQSTPQSPVSEKKRPWATCLWEGEIHRSRTGHSTPHRLPTLPPTRSHHTTPHHTTPAAKEQPTSGWKPTTLSLRAVFGNAVWASVQFHHPKFCSVWQRADFNAEDQNSSEQLTKTGKWPNSHHSRLKWVDLQRWLIPLIYPPFPRHTAKLSEACWLQIGLCEHAWINFASLSPRGFPARCKTPESCSGTTRGRLRMNMAALQKVTVINYG